MVRLLAGDAVSPPTTDEAATDNDHIDIDIVLSSITAHNIMIDVNTSREQADMAAVENSGEPPV